MVINLGLAFSLIEAHIHNQKTYLCASDSLHFYECQIPFMYNGTLANEERENNEEQEQCTGVARDSNCYWFIVD